MVALNVTVAREQLRELVDKVLHDGERVTLSRYGKPSAVLVSVEDAEMLELLEDKADLAEVKKIMKSPNPVDWEKAKAQLGL